MVKRKVLLFGGVTICAAVVLAQTVPSTLHSKRGRISGITRIRVTETARCTFQFRGQQYLSAMSAQEVEAGGAWEPSLPIPLNLAQAEEIARRELRKFVKDDFDWELTELSVNRLRGTNGPLWYFAATLKPISAMFEVNSNYFTVLINASGQPGLIGRIHSSGNR